MDKKSYFVSVQSGTIMENQGDSSYELEIKATQDEVEQLGEIFEEMDNFDQSSAIQVSAAVAIAYHHDESNDGYDYYLKEAYRMINDLGTEDTKRHISTMNILC
ncbi:hypothetical protein [Paenibacillus sp. N3.4]|uniref:hypothetical protein n=1 Tax=Paenibacillus sp. N3.4 TaxID=2603222 RepID=UPI0011C9DC90|nr:hypothetical protein [Paenibacillus sp. N3.4]TXK80020.1 hypothetical protein FU659_18795 [Paenibacillus sp. N3.4]